MPPRKTQHSECRTLSTIIDVPRGCRLYVKNEAEQDGRSIKGRVAYAMVRRSLQLGKRIVESSSGNLALGLGHWSGRLGAPAPLCLIDDCCDPTMRQELLCAGCEIETVSLTTSEMQNQTGVFKRVARAKEYQAANYYWPNQYDNNEWVEVHRSTTGSEIWEDPIGFDLVVCAVGTGATVSGIALARPVLSSGLVVGVEPERVGDLRGVPGTISCGRCGESLTPRNYHKEAVDMEIVIDDSETFEMVRLLRRAGYTIGSSGSMVIAGAAQAVSRLGAQAKAILLVIADDGWYESL